MALCGISSLPCHVRQKLGSLSLSPPDFQAKISGPPGTDQPRDYKCMAKTKATRSDQEEKSKDIVFSKHRRSKSKKFNKYFKPIVFPCNRDVARACFYSTIYLSRVRSSSHRGQQQHWAQSMKMKKKQDIATGFGVSPKSDSGTRTGDKVVLPLSEPPAENDQCNTIEKKEKVKGDKTKTMSRMKELLRWAAAKKPEKLGGKFIGRKFRSREAMKGVSGDHDQLSNESPKISFRWDVQSSSTTSSAYSGIIVTSSLRNDETCNILSLNSTPMHGLNRCCSRRGNWITTDSELYHEDDREEDVVVLWRLIHLKRRRAEEDKQKAKNEAEYDKCSK
ncbi:hypothetical protein Gotri_018441, partial [Gossypium trilobum]|nr:hypothetical protein [Gossypium trilobum]